MERRARLVRDWGEGPETFWFAEVSTDNWLELNRKPEGDDFDTARKIHQGIDPETGENTRTRPITAATRYLHMTADELTIEEIV